MRSVIIVVVLTVTSMCFGQRVCDLEAKLVLPDSGNLFHSPDPNSIDIIVINRGPDYLTPRDWVAVGLWVQGYHLTRQGQKIQDTIAPGDTLFLNQSAAFKYRVSMENISVCINRCLAWTAYGTQDTLVIEREGQPNYENNKYCVKGDVEYTLGTNDMDLSLEGDLVYPNPASSSISFKGDLEGSYFSIFNAVGQTVCEDKISDVSEFDISNLKSGVYYIILSNKKGYTVRSKFIKE